MESRAREAGQPSELDEFLPHDDKQANSGLLPVSNEHGTVIATQGLTRVVIEPKKKVDQKWDSKDYYTSYDKDPNTQYNPFKMRRLPAPTTDTETLTHLLKSCLGSGILAMPLAFRDGGVLFGIINTIITGLICGHCAYILVKSAHKVYHVARVTKLTYPELGEAAFAHGPSSLRKLAKPAKISITVGIFLTYFGTCCAYCVIVAGNIEQVLKYHNVGETVDKRWFIAALLFPLILLNYIPNLKVMAILSQTANVLMASTLTITMYYIFFVGEPIKSPFDLPQFPEMKDIPRFFSIVIFAMECIGVIMPLENNMSTPQHFIGVFGVLNKGMAFVTIVYLALGFVGFLKYGDHVQDVITLNLPLDEIPSQCAKVFIAFTVLFTHPLQMYVCLDLIWSGKHERSFIKDYSLRTILVFLTVAVAIGVPQISPFMTIIGALFFSALGLIFPVIIEIIVFWKEGPGYMGWKLIKNIFIIIFGVFAMIFGTRVGVQAIIQAYS